MKVLLINPPHSFRLRYSCQPAGIVYLATYVNDVFNDDIHVGILDSVAEGMNIEETLARVIHYKPDLVGFSFTTTQANSAYELTGQIKKQISCSVVHGGVHATALPQESLKHGADWCVIGEGEVAFTELLRDILVTGNSPPVNGQCLQEPYLKDLDSLPFPDWSLLNNDLYNETIHANNDIALPLYASRGCRHNCSFCAAACMWQRHLRLRSPEHVINEIRLMKDQYGITAFHFYDDDLLACGSHVKAIAEGLLAEKLNVQWVCLARSDSVIRNQGMLRILKESGCVGFEIGIESFDSVVLNKMKKHQDRHQITHCLEIISQHGFPYVGHLLMAFYPGESVQGHLDQKQDLTEIGIGSYDYFRLIQFSTPYPGTEFARTAETDGLVTAETWEQFHTYFVNFVPNSFLDSRLTRYQFELNEQNMQAMVQVIDSRVFRFRELGLMRALGLKRVISKYLELLPRSNCVKDIAHCLHEHYFPNTKHAMVIACLLTMIAVQFGVIKK
jgi:radical SAM superfamily enzyme YgiQ (UPF0313 family)